jgi:hypothetical protein
MAFISCSLLWMDGMKNHWIFLVLAVFLGLALSGCQAPTETPIQLRVKNVSGHDLKRLVVIFPEQRIEYGDLSAGATSDFRPVSQGVYQYAAYTVEVNGAVVSQSVIDWVGERPMPGSKFTYEIDVDPGGYARNQVIKLVGVIKDQ